MSKASKLSQHSPQKHSPEKLCDDTIFKYLLPRSLLAAAKRQVQQALGDQTLIFQEHSLSAETVELYVIAVSLSASQQQALRDLQHNEVLIQKIARSDFSANQLQFGERKAPSELVDSKVDDPANT